MDRRTDQRTDTPSYKDARTRLKEIVFIKLPKKRQKTRRHRRDIEKRIEAKEKEDGSHTNGFVFESLDEVVC